MFFAAISAISKIIFEFHTNAHYTLGKWRLPIFHGGFLYLRRLPLRGGFLYLMEASSILWRLPLSYGGFLYLMEASSMLWRLPLCYGGFLYLMEAASISWRLDRLRKKNCDRGAPQTQWGHSGDFFSR